MVFWALAAGGYAKMQLLQLFKLLSVSFRDSCSITYLCNEVGLMALSEVAPVAILLCTHKQTWC
jgi:hypothetical protein